MKLGKTATDRIGIQIRPATASDLPAVVSLAALYGIAVIGEPDTDESDFADAWNNPRTRLSDDVWLATSPNGDVVAYKHCVDPAGNGRLEIEGFVHPNWKGRAIGTVLLHRAVRRAHDLADGLPRNTRRFVRVGTFERDVSAQSLMESAGFARVRYFLRMTIRLGEARPALRPPTGRELLP